MKTSFKMHRYVFSFNLSFCTLTFFYAEEEKEERNIKQEKTVK